MQSRLNLHISRTEHRLTCTRQVTTTIPKMCPSHANQLWGDPGPPPAQARPTQSCFGAAHGSPRLQISRRELTRSMAGDGGAGEAAEIALQTHPLAPNTPHGRSGTGAHGDALASGQRTRSAASSGRCGSLGVLGRRLRRRHRRAVAAARRHRHLRKRGESGRVSRGQRGRCPGVAWRQWKRRATAARDV